MITETTKSRFESKIYRCPTSGCWLWTGCVNKKGYGKIGNSGKTDKAHRVAWELYVGGIDGELCVLHKCDVPSCCNPKHLFLGTVLDNNRDMASKGRHWSAANPASADKWRGERNGLAKLTAEMVRAIRADRRTQKQIAADFGVVFSTVGAIKRGALWHHV